MELGTYLDMRSVTEIWLGSNVLTAQFTSNLDFTHTKFERKDGLHQHITNIYFPVHFTQFPIVRKNSNGRITKKYVKKSDIRVKFSNYIITDVYDLCMETLEIVYDGP